MRKILISFSVFSFFAAVPFFSTAQLKELTVEKIMRDPKWIGEQPSGLQWSAEGNKLFFSWLQDDKEPDAQYYITPLQTNPTKATLEERRALLTEQSISYNANRTAYVYTKNGDIFYKNDKGKLIQVTSTTAQERSPSFSFAGNKIVYTAGQNLFSWDISSGETVQLTNFAEANAGQTGTGAPSGPAANASGGRGGGGGNPPQSLAAKQEQWLKNDQLATFQILRERDAKRKKDSIYYKSIEQKGMRSISLGGRTLRGSSISADGRFVAFMLADRAPAGTRTVVPNYVTASGFTENIPARTKVGITNATSTISFYDRVADTVYAFDKKILPGINDLPLFYNDYPKMLEAAKKEKLPLEVSVSSISWSPSGNRAVFEVRSINNKNRWLVKWDGESASFGILDRQYDEAWIGGPGISSFGRSTGWIDDNTFYFNSELTGYSHLYIANFTTNEKTALTSGNYETSVLKLANDKKHFYIITNETHPGEQHLYRLNIATKKQERITKQTGGYQVSISPDESHIAYLFSTATKPWELYLQANPLTQKKSPLLEAKKITDKAISEEWASYPWREPEYVSFTARDGATVYARLYKPANPHPDKPAVVFVHGAGYLQNAHKWWSQYFREYMFHNLLVDKGYTVLDMDFRASSGYGRDWRTGIYRHMGGKDLTDNVDGVKYLVEKHGVNPKNVGLYGGSYGGFITLMAMFNEPDVFAAGAALRPVTDWAQYNHGYTANILNEPYNDSIAYRRSSPLYFADGLKGKLLICHGVLDVNVHYQDAVKLTQRLIELGKDDWELASYPMEDHGFVEPSSWTDEYKRILKLFEQNLKHSK